MKSFGLFFCIFLTVFTNHASGYVKVRTVPKSGTHIMIKALYMMELPLRVSHFEPHLSSCERPIIVVRDLRDCCVSLVNYYDFAIDWGLKNDYPRVGFKKLQHCQKWQQLNFEEKLTAILTTNRSILPTLDDAHFHDNVCWANKVINSHPSDFLIVRFSNLIGGEHGNDREIQWKEFKKITTFIEKYAGIHTADDKILYCINHLWGGTITFTNNQKIGNWKNYFTQEHIDLFKKHWEHMATWSIEGETFDY